MSVLLVDPDDTWAPAIARLLVAQGDEVRVVTADRTSWENKGVYVAVGDPLDTDLVERACTNVRTVVLTMPGRRVRLSLVDVVLDAAPRAGVDRLVVCVTSSDTGLERVLAGSQVGYVIVVTGRRGFLPRVAADPEGVAEAVSAADDLADEPRLVADLTNGSGREALRLS